MTELDNKDTLLQEFFSGSKQDIADNGFSRRVMHHLPDRKRRLTQKWTVLVAIIGVLFFFWRGGLETVWGTLREVFNSMLQYQFAQFDTKSMLIAAVVLLFLGTRKVASMA